jgi:alpha-tubulin suppressor-like RCC1 family protein
LLPVAVDVSGVLSGKSILQISLGEYHTCVIANDLKAYCWGYNKLFIFFNISKF